MGKLYPNMKVKITYFVDCGTGAKETAQRLTTWCGLLCCIRTRTTSANSTPNSKNQTATQILTFVEMDCIGSNCEGVGELFIIGLSDPGELHPNYTRTTSGELWANYTRIELVNPSHTGNCGKRTASNPLAGVAGELWANYVMCS